MVEEPTREGVDALRDEAPAVASGRQLISALDEHEYGLDEEPILSIADGDAAIDDE